MKRLAAIGLSFLVICGISSCSQLTGLFGDSSGGTITIASSTPAQGSKLAANQSIDLKINYSCSVNNASQYMIKVDIDGSDGTSTTSSFQPDILTAGKGTNTPIHGSFLNSFNAPSPFKVNLSLAYWTQDSLPGSPTYGSNIWKQDCTNEYAGYYTK